MGSRYEVEVTLTSGKDLKNINWKNGPIKPYVVMWINSDHKATSRVDDDGDTDPKWNQTLIIPLNCPVEDATLYFEVVHHASSDEDIKPLIGTAKLKLQKVVDEVGIGALDSRSVKCKRPSGRPHGKLKLDVVIREAQRYGSGAYPSPYQSGGYGDSREAPSYGHQSSSYGEPAPYGHPGYGQPAPYGNPGYGQQAPEGYGQPAPAYGESAPYGDQGYGQPPQGYPQQQEEEKKEGLSTGAKIAMGAAAGVVGGVALYAGYDYLTRDDDDEDEVKDRDAEDEDEDEDDAEDEDDE